MPEICKIKISKDLLQMLVDSAAISTDDFELIGTDEVNFDYKENPVWLAAKEKSNKAFKQLKEIEFNLRHGK